MDAATRLLDERTVFKLWTSSPQDARDRYMRDIFDDPYDRAPVRPLAPRDYVRRCAFCEVAIVVTAAGGRTERRYCSTNCRMKAWYRRNRDRSLARQHAYAARKRAEKVAA